MANGDYSELPIEDNICPDCGEPLDSHQPDLEYRAALVCEALDGASSDETVVLLVKFLAAWLAQYEPDSRKQARKDVIRFLDDETRDRVARQRYH